MRSVIEALRESAVMALKDFVTGFNDKAVAPAKDRIASAGMPIPDRIICAVATS